MGEIGVVYGWETQGVRNDMYREMVKQKTNLEWTDPGRKKQNKKLWKYVES